jgi:hypothetical protein
MSLINWQTDNADYLNAQLLGEQFADWQSTFEPIELNAIEQLSFNNPSILPGAIKAADTATSGAYKTLGGTLERTNAAMGETQTPQQAQATKRMLNLDQAAATAGAENQARSNVRADDQQILLGGLPNQNLVPNVKTR